MKPSFKTLLAGAKLAALATIGLTFAPQSASAQEYYLGQLIPGGYNFCPRSSTSADGKLLPIAQNTALFSLLGTIYGGDGRTSFAVPDLRGRSALNHGNGPGLSARPQGQKSGAETVTMTVANMPSHNHAIGSVNQTGDKGGPASDFPAISSTAGQKLYHNGPADALMDGNMVRNTGGGLPMNIMNPYLVIQWCIATQGIFPSRS